MGRLCSGPTLLCAKWFELFILNLAILQSLYTPGIIIIIECLINVQV